MRQMLILFAEVLSTTVIGQWLQIAADLANGDVADANADVINSKSTSIAD